MILKVEEFQNVCKKILEAVDSSSEIADMLELKLKNKVLSLSVTNREYFVKINLNVESTDEFIAIVNAKLFLSLISKITTETLELFVNQASLIVRANGEYKLPMPSTEETLTELPEICIDNVVKSFSISGDILQSINTFNSKELNIDTSAIKIPAQKMFYLDEKGCITFTTGACVNSFTLDTPIKVLLPLKLVKLFKLFNSNEVSFTLGYDKLPGSDFIQTKVKFETSDISVTSILPGDSSLIQSVPVEAIRQRAFASYANTINITRNSLIQAINRLLLFMSSPSLNKGIGIVKFLSDKLIISDLSSANSESINYSNTELSPETNYVAYLNLVNLKTTLETCNDEFISLSFGDNEAIVISRGNIKNIISQIQTN